MWHVWKALRRLGACFQFLPRLHGSVLLSPLILVGVLCLFLFENGQVREMLIRAVEPQSPSCALQLLLGLAAMLLLSVVLFFSYLSACVVLRKEGIGYGSDLFYNSEIELKRDRRIAWCRDLAAFACAAGPPLTIGYAFWVESTTAWKRHELLEIEPPSLVDLPLQLCASDASQIPEQLARVAIAWSTLALVVLIGIALSAWLERRRGWPFVGPRPTRTRRHWLLGATALVVLIAPLPLINFAPVSYDALLGVVGPLATLGLVLMATAWLLFYVGEWSRRCGIPFFVITAIAVFVFGLYAWAHTPLEWSEWKSEPWTSPTREMAWRSNFEDWLKSRKNLAQWHQPADAEGQEQTRPPYPVYVIAAPGGGIYAASFVASVMARLESECPAFTQHVFVLSAVSGGAIGSASVNAVSQGAEQLSSVDCRDGAGNQDPGDALVKRLLLDDHLSPALAATVPEVIVKLVQILGYETRRLLMRLRGADGDPTVSFVHGRAEALETSFAEALRRACAQKRAATALSGCAEENGANPLRVLFSDHWKPNGAAPALILNTTWAETGDRIAFAPFSLKDVGDGTLKATTDLPDPQGEPATLVAAAIASARFPAILPAKIVRPPGEANRILWHNLVDGGYADASGVTTALEVYKAISAKQGDIEEKTRIRFELKLLILTDASTDLKGESTSGAGLIHAITPITTVLTIREQMGRRAVARAMKELAPTKLSEANKGVAPWCPIGTEVWRARRITLDTARFRLSLGWTLSRHTSDMIDRIVNDSGSLRSGPENSPGPKIAKENVDTFRAIKENLMGRCTEGS